MGPNGIPQGVLAAALAAARGMGSDRRPDGTPNPVALRYDARQLNRAAADERAAQESGWDAVWQSKKQLRLAPLFRAVEKAEEDYFSYVRVDPASRANDKRARALGNAMGEARTKYFAEYDKILQESYNDSDEVMYQQAQTKQELASLREARDRKNEQRRQASAARHTPQLTPRPTAGQVAGRAAGGVLGQMTPPAIRGLIGLIGRKSGS